MKELDHSLEKALIGWARKLAFGRFSEGRQTASGAPPPGQRFIDSNRRRFF